MIGVSEGLSKQMTDREWFTALDAVGSTLDLRGEYQRTNGDGSVLPLRSHLRWIDDGHRMTLVSLEGGVKAARKKIEAYRIGKGQLVVTDEGEIVAKGDK